MENRFHLYVIGSEECENSIAYSAVSTRKDKWLGYLQSALGDSYVKIRSQTLQAIHLVLFAHETVAPLIADVYSGAVACGLGNTLGNKGGRYITFSSLFSCYFSLGFPFSLVCVLSSLLSPLFKKNVYLFKWQGYQSPFSSAIHRFYSPMLI